MAESSAAAHAGSGAPPTPTLDETTTGLAPGGGAPPAATPPRPRGVIDGGGDTTTTQQTARVVVANVYAGGATASFDLSPATSVGTLKAHVETAFADRPAPSEQRLIYAGKICDNDATPLRDILGRGGGLSSKTPQTFHLVVWSPKKKQTTSSSSTTEEGSLSRSVSSPAAPAAAGSGRRASPVTTTTTTTETGTTPTTTTRTPRRDAAAPAGGGVRRAAERPSSSSSSGGPPPPASAPASAAVPRQHVRRPAAVAGPTATPPPRDEPPVPPREVDVAARAAWEYHAVMARTYEEALRNGGWLGDEALFDMETPRVLGGPPISLAGRAANGAADPRQQQQRRPRLSYAAMVAVLATWRDRAVSFGTRLARDPLIARLDPRLALKLAVVVALLGHNADRRRVTTLVAVAVAAFLVQTGLFGLALGRLVRAVGLEETGDDVPGEDDRRNAADPRTNPSATTTAGASSSSSNDEAAPQRPWHRHLVRVCATGRISPTANPSRLFDLALLVASFGLSLSPAWRPLRAPEPVRLVVRAGPQRRADGAAAHAHAD